MIKNVDVHKLASDLSKQMSDTYTQLVKDAYAAIADENGNATPVSIMTAEIETLRYHLESYTAELISQVLTQALSGE